MKAGCHRIELVMWAALFDTPTPEQWRERPGPTGPPLNSRR
jgi:hypothetical protein